MNEVSKPKPMREAVAVLEELDLQIDKIGISTSISREDIYWSMGAKAMRKEIKLLIQQQINTLKGS